MKSLLIVAGPTASGKTAVCLEIAKRLPVETVSFDSMQVYRGMPVLTQAPTAAQKRSLKAHLVTFLKPEESYDAARFRRDASERIGKILKRGRTPLLSGGTGLYLRALLDGLFESAGSPETDPALREKWESEHKLHGGTHLHDQLKKIDPASAMKIHPNDTRRIVRALEVHALSGKPLSQRKGERKGIRADFHCPVFYLDRDRKELYERVERRVDAMLKAGLLREVKRVLKKNLSPTARAALGIKEMRDFLENGTPLEQAVSKLKQHTRNYAKRQICWFRHEKGAVRVPVEASEKPAVTAKKILDLWESSR